MIIRNSAVVVGLALTVLGSAPSAQADENMYLQQIRQPNKLFITITNSQLIQLGLIACETMRVNINGGMSMAQARGLADKAVAQAAYSMGLESDRASNMNITSAAEDNLC